jgi:hypothetical protein
MCIPTFLTSVGVICISVFIGNLSVGKRYMSNQLNLQNLHRVTSLKDVWIFNRIKTCTITQTSAIAHLVDGKPYNWAAGSNFIFYTSPVQLEEPNRLR